MKWFYRLFNKKPKVIVVLGSTATGKTSLAVHLAQLFNGEVVSADSRQVYRGLDIGSAKVTTEEAKGIPHHMIDIVGPQDRYTVAQYVHEATEVINDIIDRKRVPIICGGTGMYIDALVYGQMFPEVAPNDTLRKQLEAQREDDLFAELRRRDPDRAKIIDPKNKVRLIRALEIVESLGTVPEKKSRINYRPLFIGLDIPKEILNERIHQRIIDRLEDQDMLSEAKRLHTSGLSYDRMEELGLEYRYMAKHLKGQLEYQDMINELSTATRQFAKRQRTWFKRNKHIHWFNPLTDQELIKQKVARFLSKAWYHN